MTLNLETCWYAGLTGAAFAQVQLSSPAGSTRSEDSADDRRPEGDERHFPEVPFSFIHPFAHELTARVVCSFPCPVE